MNLPVTTTKQPRPPRILLYGPGGIGKSEFAAYLPGTLALPVEDGLDAYDVAKLPTPKTWEEALGYLSMVAENPGSYSSLTIDSITKLEDLAKAHVAARAKVKTIEEMPYGTGVPALMTEWRTLLDSLNNIRAKGLAVLLIGHTATVSYADPRSQAYDRFQPRLHLTTKGQGTLPMTFEWCDGVFCAAYQVFTASEDKGFNKERIRAIGGGGRILYTTEMPTHLAKNRWGLPAELPFPPRGGAWSAIFDGISRAYAPTSPAVATATA